MLTMYLLRILVDVSFYCAFAAFIASQYGGTGSLPVALLQCLCFVLAAAGGKRRSLRLLLLLPMGAGWYLCRSSVADCLLFLPTAIYILFLTWQGDYTLSRDRQQRIFSAFWKVGVFLAPVTVLMGGGQRLAAVSLPYIIVTLTASVLLLRSLRHDPKVYCQRKYQLVNLLTIAVLLAAALFLGSDLFLNTCLAAIRAVYRHLIMPILMGLLYLFLLVMHLLTYLAALLKLKSPKTGEEVQIDDRSAADFLGEMAPTADPNLLLRSLFILVGIAVAVLLLYLFFRWLNRRNGDEPSLLGTPELRSGLPDLQPVAAQRDTSPVRSIRSLYRKFLRLCGTCGIHPEQSGTSLDVHLQACQKEALSQVSGPIRELYIQARYAGRGDKEAVQQMKKLYSQGKKNQKL